MKEVFQDRGVFTKYYDKIYAGRLEGTLVEGDVAFYLGQARRTGGPVLELGCGTGRVALPLANRGYAVTGLDRSPHMLAVARRKSAMLPPKGRVAWVRGRMERFALGRRFGLVLIPFRAFQHLLTASAQRSCLACARRHLKPGGRLVVDLFDPRLDYCLPESRRVFWQAERYADPATGRRITVRCTSRKNDPLTQTFREVWSFTVRQGAFGRVVARSVNEVRLRWTFRHEMHHLLELTGFRVLACHSDFRGSPPRYGREQVWVATPAAGRP